ncbi:putative metallopeptidase [Achromobacter xylosoxidans]|uniref:putative metallopeptidase n=1 Tax=Alcaligenes xylosoxydans xylosoxydans TaxID=85698 RepID=UPI00398740E5
MKEWRGRSAVQERPRPPAEWLARAEAAGGLLAPAPQLLEWTERVILAADGPLHNPDHAHLVDADLAFLWASSGFEKAGRVVLGQAERGQALRLLLIGPAGWPTSSCELHRRADLVL